MLDNKEIGRNLNILRTLYGYKQKEIAAKIGVSESAYSMVEKGDRAITADKLEVLATLYGVSAGSIYNKELDRDFGFDNDHLDDSFLNSFLVDCYPYFPPMDETADEAFCKGNQQAVQAFKAFGQSFSLGAATMWKRFLNLALDSFLKSWEQTKNSKAIVNCLFVLYVTANFLAGDPTDSDYGTELMNVAKLSDSFQYQAEHRQDRWDKIGAYYREKKDLINRCIRTLKEDGTYSDIADYYLCLGYVTGLVDNDKKAEENQEFGLLYMISLSEIGNSYAERYIKHIAEAYDIKP